MATTDVKDPLVRASDLGVEKEEVMHHPLNPLSEIRGHSLSERAGLTRLGLHALDVVLSTRKVASDARNAWRCRRIARQPVSLVGKPRGRGKPFRFPEDLAHVPLLLPGRDSDIRAGFDLLCEQLGLRCHVLAEVDDMALLRLLARDSHAVALVPPVVVRDELRARRLAEYCVVPRLHEDFYAITVPRHFVHPLLKTLLAQPENEVLEAAKAPVGQRAGGAPQASR